VTSARQGGDHSGGSSFWYAFYCPVSCEEWLPLSFLPRSSQTKWVCRYRQFWHSWAMATMGPVACMRAVEPPVCGQNEFRCSTLSLSFNSLQDANDLACGLHYSWPLSDTVTQLNSRREGTQWCSDAEENCR
jgi:hypothetical protein